MRFWLKILIVPEAACRAKSPGSCCEKSSRAAFPSPRSESKQPVPRRYDLGMDDFVDSAAFEGRKENLSLSLKRQSRARKASAAQGRLIISLRATGASNMFEA